MIIKTERETFENYLSDASNYRGECNAVYIPDSADEIVDILKRANKERTRLTIAGNGTGLNGGRCPLGGIVVSLEKLNRILTINKSARTATVEAGVLLGSFQSRLNEDGLFYPPDPTEQNCHIGATISTNASGAKSYFYGPTRKFVRSLEIILPTGEKIFLERGKHRCRAGLNEFSIGESCIQFTMPRYAMPRVKNAAGYFTGDGIDLIDLFIGSEGTLGIITKAELLIHPLPDEIISCVVFFEAEESALNFIDEARTIGKGSMLCPRALEFFDVHSLTLLRNTFPTIPSYAQAAVWFEQEAQSTSVEPVLQQWMEMLQNHTQHADGVWYAADGKELIKIREFRHAISALVNEYIGQHQLRKLGTDTAVPQESFRTFYDFAKQCVTEQDTRYVAYGHFGDCHLHLNMLPADKREFETGKKMYELICKKAIELGGTISAEHGIGKTKHHLLALMYGTEAVKDMARLKLAFDPNSILNVGNMFPENLPVQ